MIEAVLVELERRVADLERRLRRTISIGRVAAVQERPYRAVVNLGTEEQPLLTAPLHVVIPRAGASMVEWSPVEEGEGVLVLAPHGGDAMFVLPALARGFIELVAGSSGAHYFLGSGSGGRVVAGGDVKACASVHLGAELPGGVSLAAHTHLLVPGSGAAGPPPAVTHAPTKV